MPIRLTIVYTFIWTVVLAGLLFICRTMLNHAERTNASTLLAADLAAVKGYLRIENGKMVWYADLSDPDEKVTVTRLQRNLMVTDSQGKFMEIPPSTVDLHRAETKTFDAALHAVQQTRANFSTTAKDQSGHPFLLLCAQLRDESGAHQYYAFLSRSIAGNESVMVGLFRNRLFLILLAAGLSFCLSSLMVRHCIATA